MAKCFLRTETRDELHYLKFEIIAMSRCLSVPDTTSLHHCLKNKQLKHIWFQLYESKYLVSSTVEEVVANTCI